LIVKCKVLIAVMLACSTVTAYAWLDATEQQCEVRYGKPKLADVTTPGSDKTISYLKDDIHVNAEFVKGKCVRIDYGVHGFVTQGQIDVFFKANGGASAWSHYDGGGGDDYVRHDGLAIARVTRYYGGGVTFTENQWQKAHDEAVKELNAAKQAAEKERIEKKNSDF
jgi:hypothetical protein